MKTHAYSFNIHHHHVVLVARISLNLSRHFSLLFIASGRSSGLHPVSSHSCWMYVRAGRPALARPCVGVHKSTSLMSSSLLLKSWMRLFAFHIELIHLEKVLIQQFFLWVNNRADWALLPWYGNRSIRRTILNSKLLNC